MKAYTVHEQPLPVGDRIDRAEALRFVSDGFDAGAALVAPFFLLAHKLYLGLGIYAVALAAILAVVTAAGLTPGAIALAVGALHVLTGFEVGELERTELDRNGWTDLGPVSGRSRADCERAFFARWLDRQPLIASIGTPTAGPRTDTPVVAPSRPKAPRPAVLDWRNVWRNWST